MAIYHLSAQLIKRSDGRNAVAAAAYRSGDQLTDEITGEVKDYRLKDGVVHSQIYLPKGAPAAFADRGTLWNAVEQKENRKDAQLARELNVALPNELTRSQQIELLDGFINEQFVELGMIADTNIHVAHEGKHQNDHAHIQLTLREVAEDGFGRKNRDWNKKELVEQWRQAWENHVNQALENAGIDDRIDHRSHKDRELDTEPTIHLGPTANELESKGVRTERGDINRDIEARNNVIELAKTQERIRELKEEKRQRDDKALDDAYVGSIEGVSGRPGKFAAESAKFTKTVDLAFEKHGNVYVWRSLQAKGKTVPAFIEHKDKITAHTRNKTALKAMAQASMEKFGQRFRATGSEEFRRELWLQGSMIGADVTGFDPTDEDIRLLRDQIDEHEKRYGRKPKLSDDIKALVMPEEDLFEQYETPLMEKRNKAVSLKEKANKDKETAEKSRMRLIERRDQLNQRAEGLMNAGRKKDFADLLEEARREVIPDDELQALDELEARIKDQEEKQFVLFRGRHEKQLEKMRSELRSERTRLIDDYREDVQKTIEHIRHAPSPEASQLLDQAKQLQRQIDKQLETEKQLDEKILKAAKAIELIDEELAKQDIKYG